MIREYKTVRALRAGEAVDFEGVKFRMIPGPLLPGDIYIAERNSVELLEVGSVVTASCGCCVDYVIPTTPAYCFNGSECVKVEMVEDED